MDTDSLPLSVLFDALTLAADEHQYQRRSGYDRLPYVNHLLKVTRALIQIGGESDPELLLAALLHDIIEDTEVSEKDLASRFNPRTARIVAELTDDMSLPYGRRKKQQLEKAALLSPEAQKIRIADKASNIRDLLDYPIDWPIEKKQHYVTHSLGVVDQIRGVQPALEAWFDELVKEAKEKWQMKTEN